MEYGHVGHSIFRLRRMFSEAVAHIRVVKAFQAGLDRREPSLAGHSAARLREISRQLRLQAESEGRGRSASRGNIKANEPNSTAM
ncbi:hypothetical protein DICVIV_09193 [Dictyocaulus viviparus]|uniref:Uncharacterized protein n=1 Tax=Dictyocaulus viviparus TaxID=29172 RepID=A0A0D8XR07_DICVI|nr:hypothetical protein DICVIV_09193 [Dictyocaulus viviparus]